MLDNVRIVLMNMNINWRTLGLILWVSVCIPVINRGADDWAVLYGVSPLYAQFGIWIVIGIMTYAFFLKDQPTPRK